MNDNIALAAGFSLSLIGVGAPEAVLSTLAAIAAFVHAGIALVKLVARVVSLLRKYKHDKITTEELIDGLDEVKEDFDNDV